MGILCCVCLCISTANYTTNITTLQIQLFSDYLNAFAFSLALYLIITTICIIATLQCCFGKLTTLQRYLVCLLLTSNVTTLLNGNYPPLTTSPAWTHTVGMLVLLFFLQLIIITNNNNKQALEKLQATYALVGLLGALWVAVINHKLFFWSWDAVELVYLWFFLLIIAFNHTTQQPMVLILLVFSNLTAFRLGLNLSAHHLTAVQHTTYANFTPLNHEFYLPNQTNLCFYLLLFLILYKFKNQGIPTVLPKGIYLFRTRIYINVGLYITVMLTSYTNTLYIVLTLSLFVFVPCAVLMTQLKNKIKIALHLYAFSVILLPLCLYWLLPNAYSITRVIVLYPLAIIIVPFFVNGRKTLFITRYVIPDLFSVCGTRRSRVVIN